MTHLPTKWIAARQDVHGGSSGRTNGRVVVLIDRMIDDAGFNAVEARSGPRRKPRGGSTWKTGITRVATVSSGWASGPVSKRTCTGRVLMPSTLAS